MSAPDRVKRIVSHYENLYDKHGDSPLASDYGSVESQATKFRVLSEATDYSGKSVLDVGCGFGTFASYLSNRYDGVDYHGVDITPSIAEEARRKYPDLTIECRDIINAPPDRKYDVVTANGIFYLVPNEPEEFMHSMITHMFSLCREVVAVNTLSVWADLINANEYYANPASMIDFCRTLTSNVTLRHDYMRHDFTLYLYREK